MAGDKLGTVIKALDQCTTVGGCCGCPYSVDEQRTIECVSNMMTDALELLKEQQKTGKWEEKVDYVGDTYYDCSVCGESWITIDGTPWQNGMNYCPHCGAKMELAK